MSGQKPIRSAHETPGYVSVAKAHRAYAVVDVLGALLAILEPLAVEWPVTCTACGCLCRPDEVCPGCRARRAAA